jgi:hypothetical protein
MRVPGFTAEASLNTTNGHYRVMGVLPMRDASALILALKVKTVNINTHSSLKFWTVWQKWAKLRE